MYVGAFYPVTERIHPLFFGSYLSPLVCNRIRDMHGARSNKLRAFVHQDINLHHLLRPISFSHLSCPVQLRMNNVTARLALGNNYSCRQISSLSTGPFSFPHITHHYKRKRI